jgi:hypothetical protein
MILAAAVMTACASTSVKARRPLITDKTPLGTKTVLVARWFEAHGWCVAEREGDRVLLRLCDQKQPLVLAVLSFRGDVLVQADVRVPVGSSRDGVPMPIHGTSPPGPDPSAPVAGVRPMSARIRDNANELLDALAYELDSRYGRPVDNDAQDRALTWVTDQERITLYLERRSWIVERHTRTADPDVPVQAWPPMTGNALW